MISSADPKKIVDENKSKLFLKLSLNLKFKNPTNTFKKSVHSFKPSSIFAKDILMIRETAASVASNKDKAQGREDLIGIEKEKQKVDTTGIDVLKLVLSREGETDKFKSQLKSSLKPNKKIASTSTNEIPKEIDSEKSAKSSNDLFS